MPPLLQVRQIYKSYNAPVLSSVELEVGQGEVHALVGANGAGKSTLARIICGMTAPDSGELRLLGEPYNPATKRDAETAGVHIVQQELNLVPTLSVAENLFLSRLPNRMGFISRGHLARKTREALAAVGLTGVHPDVKVSSLGVGQQQLVEIASALTRNVRLLILDEPTAMLTQPEVELLFTRVRELQQAGVGLIYISHRMEEIRAISNRISVLRDGQVVLTRPSTDMSIEDMVSAMTGTSTAAVQSRPRPGTSEAPVALEVRRLSRGKLTRDVSFSLRRGEILGLGGLVGSGRTETLRAIFGADRPQSGEVLVGSPLKPVRIRSPRDAVRAGIGMLPEDRKALGLLLTQPIAANVSLARMGAVAAAKSWISPRREHNAAAEYCRRLVVRCAGMRQRVGQLSGGNQQKVLIARWLMRDCDVLLFDEPSRGIDLGARRTIYELLRNLADSGKAIVVASSDQQELVELCDRIGIMSAGKLVRIFERDAWDEEQMMTAAFSEYSGRRRNVAATAEAGTGANV